MPHLFSFASHANDDALQEMAPEDLPQKRLRRPTLLKNPWGLLKRQHHGDQNAGLVSTPATAPTELAHIPEYFPTRRPSLPDNVLGKKVIPSLPRPQTFRRQESERRERLLEVEPTPNERRTLSADRRRSRGLSASRHLSPGSTSIPSTSAPDITLSNDSAPAYTQPPVDSSPPKHAKSSPKDLPPLDIPTVDDSEVPVVDESGDNDDDDDIDKTSLQEEYDRRWILNLSMHFRDKSNREKFFVTYAEKPNQWRRITVSLDYRNAPADSLEADLSTLHYQHDKSLRIYEAIRESLPDIQYYESVTNLKLETTPEDGQLHVHVREDANETIQYPTISLFDHVRCPRVNESALEFDSHLSGFVYKVRLPGRVVIKKEIPGPDTVDEFLYEVNALDSLLGCNNIVQLEGLVTDDRGELVKGLLISYAIQGALVDMIYDFRGTSQLPWHRREKWAKQIVTGLSEIHEAGFVQGDFTLSNIVIDEEDNAQIIDINRRGCPVGWEPPELGRLIDSGQRIGMCIGVKTDLFQLGMVLWALAEEVDEPERVERPLPEVFDEIPVYFREMVQTCLSVRPQGRSGARQLLDQFPDHAGLPPLPGRPSVGFNQESQMSDTNTSTATHRSAKEYIDPDLAVTIDEVKDRRRPDSDTSHLDADQVAYPYPGSNPASSTYRFESSGSWVIGRRSHGSRGRSPVSSRRRRSSPFGRTPSSATSLSEDSPAARQKLGDKRGSGDGATELEPPGAFSSSHEEVTEANGRAFQRTAAPSSLMDQRLTAVQGQDSGRVSELTHKDSGFDETLEELDLDCSQLTEGAPVQRLKTYVSDEDTDEGEGHISSAEPETPGSFHTAQATPGFASIGEAKLRTLSSAGVATDDEAKHSDDTKPTSNDRDDGCMPVEQQNGNMAH